MAYLHQSFLNIATKKPVFTDSEHFRSMGAASQLRDVSSSGPGNGFAIALSQALHHLDGKGQLTRDDARSVRRAIAKTSREIRLGIGREPERYLGPFESLPLQSRQAIVRTIVDDDRWRLAGRELSTLRINAMRSLNAIRSKLPHRKFGRLANAIDLLTASVNGGPGYIAYKSYRWRLALEGKCSSQPPLAAVLTLADIEPRTLAICYARAIPQLVEHCGYWHHPLRNNTQGVVLGIDFVPTENGYFYIESNLDASLGRARALLYDRDPFVTNLFQFTTAHGYVSLALDSLGHMNDLMVRQCKEYASTKKIKLTIAKNLCSNESGESNGTLAVRTRLSRTSLDYLFHHKWASSRALQLYKGFTSEPDLLVPSCAFDPFSISADAADPFPNLVFKFPQLDRGKSVIFLKTRSQEEARNMLEQAILSKRPRRFTDRLEWLMNNGDGFYQPYIRPSILPGNRLYKVRALVLLTPIGAHFLSAHRVVSRYPLPEHLPFGVVQDPSPYIVNHSLGGIYEVLPPEEEPGVVEAALAVARGLSSAAAYSFQTGPSTRQKNWLDFPKRRRDI